MALEKELAEEFNTLSINLWVWCKGNIFALGAKAMGSIPVTLKLTMVRA